MTFINGYCTGMYVEGGCRWGFDPIWTDQEEWIESDSSETEEDSD